MASFRSSHASSGKTAYLVEYTSGGAYQKVGLRMGYPRSLPSTWTALGVSNAFCPPRASNTYCYGPFRVLDKIFLADAEQGRLYVSSAGSPRLSLGAILEGRCGTSYCLDRCSLPKCCLRFPLLLPAIVMRFILAPSSRRDSGCPLLSLQLFPLRCSSLFFLRLNYFFLLFGVHSSTIVKPLYYYSHCNMRGVQVEDILLLLLLCCL